MDWSLVFFSFFSGSSFGFGVATMLALFMNYRITQLVTELTRTTSENTRILKELIERG